MIKTASLLVIISVILTATNSGKICAPCPPIPKLYDELGCYGIPDENGCCFKRFECPDLAPLKETQCYLNDKLYKIGQYAIEADLPLCDSNCRCEAGPRHSKFACPVVECPSISPSKCFLRHHINHCCPRTICDKKIKAKRAKCSYKGEVHAEGDKFYPENYPCYYCICDKYFDNTKPIPTNKNCRKINCGFELRYFHLLRLGCVPIYFQSSACCPHDFRCPNEKDEVIRLERTSDMKEIPENMCKFGNHTLQIGDRLNSTQHNVKCTCKHPPIVECIESAKL